MNQEEFQLLLEWLDSDRERAGVKYEQIRTLLIRFFMYRVYSAAESLADEVINRVASKVRGIKDKYEGDPSYYFLGTARYVLKEFTKKSQLPVIPTPPYVPEVDRELRFECFDECLKKLPPSNRELILSYFSYDKKKKIENRKKLAESFGIDIDTLRMRVRRINLVLKPCVIDCVKQKKENPGYVFEV